MPRLAHTEGRSADGGEVSVVELKLALQGKDEELTRLWHAVAHLEKELSIAKAGRWYKLHVKSPCTELYFETSAMEPPEDDEEEKLGWHRWNSWCPCCKRPLDVMLTHGGPWRGNVRPSPFNITTKPEPPLLVQTARYAFVAAIWGDDLGFVLGALVLGASLKRYCLEGERVNYPDLVLLHTEAVTKTSLEVLATV